MTQDVLSRTPAPPTPDDLTAALPPITSLPQVVRFSVPPVQGPALPAVGRVPVPALSLPLVAPVPPAAALPPDPDATQIIGRHRQDGTRATRTPRGGWIGRAVAVLRRRPAGEDR